MENVNANLGKYKKGNLNTKLLKNLEDKLEDKDFYDLVSKLNMSKEELCKYTSILEESADEYAHCKKCKSLASCKNRVTGYAYLPKKVNGNLKFEYKACKHQKKYLDSTKNLKNIYTYKVPEELLKARFKDVYLNQKARFDAIKWLKEFLKRYPECKKGLYLYGSFGCGKTYLVSAMFNELANKKIKSAIISWPEYLNNLKTQFSTYNNDFKRLIDMVKYSPLLLIDDIGAENSTPWSRDEILFPILNYRMEENLPTFFTSNFSLEELEEHFSNSKKGADSVKARRLMERIKKLSVPMEIVSENLRK